MKYGDDYMTKEKIEKFEKYLKNALLGILAILIYFVLPSFAGIIFQLFNIDTSTLSTNIKIIYSLIFDILTMALIILIFYKQIKKDIIDIKKNHREYFSKCFKYWIIGLIVMMISNLIITFISKGEIAGNQETINELFKINPLYIYFSAVIFAPVIEELVFRKAIKNIIPNKYIFILTSGLIFGWLHINGNINNWYDALYLIPYSSLGVAFAYMLYKTDNIFTTIGFHFMHNGILIALQFFLLIFG